MTMRYLNADGAFDSETTRLLGLAFEAACRKLEASGASAEPAHAGLTRELLAKRIIARARRGERNHDRLVEAALGHALGPNVVSGPWITSKTA